MPGATYTPAKSVFDNGNDLLGQHVYGNPIYNDEFISKTLKFCLSLFQQQPKDTTFTLVVPRWTNAPWWPIVERYFRIIRTIDTATPAFTRAKIFDNANDKNIPTEQLDNDRIIIGAQKWPLVIIHLSRDTPITIDDTVLAHLRFGHAGDKVLQRIFESGVATGLKHTSYKCMDLLCHVCNTLKATRPQFKNISDDKRSQLPAPLHSLYMDIHGPLNPSSVNGYRYVLGLICASSGYCWTRILKLKADASDAVHDILNEINTDPTISTQFLQARTVLYSDNAKEFTTTEMKKFLQTNRIRHELTSPYNHIENLYIERLWRTLGNMARAFLSMSAIPLKFWPTAWRHAAHVYILLPRPHRENDSFISPFERLTGKAPSLAHLHIFGCDAYAYIEPGARKGGKLEAARARHGRYIGHGRNLRTIYVFIRC
jgi:hypothetical protein